MTRHGSESLASSALDPVAVAAAVLGTAVRDTSLTRAPIAYDPYLAGRVVERARGMATLHDGGEAPWSAVIKHTEGAGLRAARRELAVYRFGLADAGPPHALRGPVLLAFDEGPAHVEVWLEDLADEHGGNWAVERFGVAASHIAAWDAAAARLALPADFDSEDAWAERHGQPERVDEVVAELDTFRAADGADQAMAQLRDPGFRRLERLIATTPERIARLASYAVSPLHHDLVRSNLFALADGRTAAIDWENVGRGPLGVDLAPLVIGSVRRGEASVDDLPAIESVVLDAYVAALRAEGILREADVRAAYRLALGLRWHVVRGTIEAWLDPACWGMRGSRRDEPRAEGLRHLVGVSRHILDAGEAM
jgi:hypothetical protein